MGMPIKWKAHPKEYEKMETFPKDQLLHGYEADTDLQLELTRTKFKLVFKKFLQCQSFPEPRCMRMAWDAQVHCFPKMHLI